MTLENLQENYIYIKVSTSAQIIYHYNISPGSIAGIVTYIFTTGRSLWSGVGIEILTNVYTYDNNHSHAMAGVSQRVNK